MSDKPRHTPSKILLIDGTNSLYRAFFAIPHLRAPDGTPTNAAYGFVNMLLKVLREQQPDCAVVVFDARGPTFRHKLYDAYKANREAQPEELLAQFPIVCELVEAHCLPILSVPDFEADDVIATLVHRAPADAQISIVSTDKDLMQLVGDRVTLLDGVKDRRYGPAEVEERFGVPPDRILDLRALVGDPSDNIPGVKGIGEKGAAKLIQKWETLENLLEHRAEITATRARNALAEQVEEALLSKRLATLRTDVPLSIDLGAVAPPEPDSGALRDLYQRLGFVRLVEALDAEGGGGAPKRAVESVEVCRVEDEAALDALIDELGALSVLPILCVLDAERPVGSDGVGIAVALSSERAAYIALGDASGQLSLETVAQRLRALIGAPGNVAWIARDAKQVEIVFAQRGVELGVPYFDVEIAAHLLDPAGANTLSALASRELGREIRSWEELAGRGAKARGARELPVSELSTWACDAACTLHALCEPLARRLDEHALTSLFQEVELPLTRVLARMECTGVRVDESVLAALSQEWSEKLERIEAEIFELAGERFLVSSPKQLQTILFEKLKLPVIKKTKTGYSTDEKVLEQLANQHELPARILVYRRLAKLRSTYVEALPPMINPVTGRIHPTFHQLGAATGRLSAAEPNVQNIPIRSADGIRIREAFIPAEGRLLLSADYSQVELRILAHYSQDESLVDAFERGEDIHRRTAAEVAGVALEDVSDEQRAHAKAINFGIVYGQSAFGLANQLGIASAEAQQTIDAYFERYHGVRAFLDQTIASAKECGFVQTLLGRRRYLGDITSRNRTLRSAAERMAVNSVIQGTAADLIKKAMVELDSATRAAGLEARMILQVHDELVFEVPPAEIDTLTQLVRERMESALPLRVPLRVDIGVGKNWREAH